MSRKMLYAFALSLAIGLANASALVVPCPDCDHTAMYNEAIARGTGSWTVWNPANGEIHRWMVICGIPPAASGAPISGGTESGDQTQAVCTGEEAAITQEMQDTAANLSSIYNLTAHSYTTVVAVPGDSWRFVSLPQGEVGSAYDYITNANYRAQLNDKLDENALDFARATPVVVPMRYVLAHADVAFAFGAGVRFVATVAYPDGTYFKIIIKLMGAPEYEPGSARDGTGQVIPDGIQQGNAGRWTYGSGDKVSRDRLVGTMKQLGFEFPSALPPDYGTITCRWDAAIKGLGCIVSD